MWLRKCAAVCVILAALCSIGWAARLEWQPNSEAHLAGYKIYYGSASEQYTNSVDVGNVTEWPIPDEWPKNQNYYFAATAYGNCWTCGENNDLWTTNSDGDPWCYEQDFYFFTCESSYGTEAVLYADAGPVDPPEAATDVKATLVEIEDTPMASYVQSNFNMSGDGFASTTVTLNSITAGNLLVAILYIEGSAITPTISDGTSNFTLASSGVNPNTIDGTWDQRYYVGYLLSANAATKQSQRLGQVIGILLE
jgi:hypothetical protein